MASKQSWLLILVLFCLLSIHFCNANASEVSDDDISRMSVKKLKEFIRLRGLECSDCVEKSHLVQFAKEHKDSPLVPENVDDLEQEILQYDIILNEDNDVVVQDVHDQQVKFTKEKVKQASKKEKSSKPANPSPAKKNSSSGRNAAAIWASKAKNMCGKYGEEVGTALGNVIEQMEKNFLPIFAKTAGEVKDLSLQQPYRTMGEFKVQSICKQVESYETAPVVEELQKSIQGDLSQWFLQMMQSSGGTGGFPGMNFPGARS